MASPEQGGLPSRQEYEPGASILPTEARQAHRVLENISPGQPTDSPVEYIAPRRPRPGPGSPSLLAAPLPQASLPVQRSVKEAPDSGDASTSYPVETELGPLPSDLWNLIGQAPPGPDASRPDTSQPASPPAGEHPPGPAAIQTQPDAQQTTQVSSPSALFPPAIQRQAVLQEQSDVAEPAGDLAQAGPPAPEKNAADEMDMDELARRVYGEVRRRLSVEWERIRRRL